MESLTELMFANEPLFIESLEAIIQQSGTTQQHCIAQLRSLGLPDDFWMYVFKVVPCAKSYSHKWTLCPCAHAGETARRRDPRVVNYRAVLCPIVKGKKTCPLGDSCSYAHNVFEHWLHPSRYKTRLCSFGRNCNRPICFFAHSADELRCVPNSDDGKDVDEREYMLQVMMAQQSDNAANQTASNLLTARSLGSISSPATPLNGMHSLNAFTPNSSSQNPYSSLIDPLASTLSATQSSVQQLQNTQAQLAAQQAQLASYLNAAPIRVKPQLQHQHSLPAHLMAATGGLNMNDALQLVGLQEALAAINLQALDSAGHSGSLSVGATPHSNASRASDPGLPGAPAADALKMLNGMAMNRISESGQPSANLGLTSPKGLAASLESLLPFLQQSQQPQQPQPERAGSFGSSAQPSGNGAGSSGSQTGQAQSQPTSPTLRRTTSPTDCSTVSTGSPSNNTLQSQPSLATQPSLNQLPQQTPRASTSGAESSQDVRLSGGDALQRQMSEPSALMNFNTQSSTPRLSQSRPPLMRAASVGPLYNLGQQQQQASLAQQQQQQQQQAQQALQQQQALQALAAAAAAGGGNAALGQGTVNKIVSELQEQGLAGTKEQLVASLSSLLAQLLASSPTHQ